MILLFLIFLALAIRGAFQISMIFGIALLALVLLFFGFRLLVIYIRTGDSDGKRARYHPPQN